jgi:hypothetical protein
VDFNQASIASSLKKEAYFSVVDISGYFEEFVMVFP